MFTNTNKCYHGYSFYVVDSQSASSPVRTVVVFYCTGCSGHWTCDYTTARPNSISQSFQLAVCNCITGWTGDECEKDFDGCLETPCISGQNCTDLTPDQQVALGRGYNCSSCPLGYDVNNVTNKCEDVNECNTTTHGCSQECNNTDGSYFCTCRKGYRLNTNGLSCDDLNECAEKTDNCSQICNNIDGGYNCSCEPGYNMDVNGTCIQEETAKQICDKANCSQGCKVENKTAECFCMPGYTINTNNKTRCDDIDECSKMICSQRCNNSVGSFTCSCYAGFHLEADGTTCSPCPSLQYGPGCLNTCECNGRGTACNPVRGCACQSGWRGINCQEDVNECEDTPNICGSTLQFCVNTNGSYRCDCLQGYTKNSLGLCTDVNECESGSGLNTCGNLEMCTNTVGSFYCSCRVGYFRNATICTDVDECLSGVATCQQVCVNTLGSYNCKCKYGFRLNADRVTCSQVQDVCLGEEHLQCAHGCTLNSNDRAVCFCRAGYKLGTDLQACIDIDECHIGTANCSHTCTNLPGSFVCTCPVGYYLQTDQKTCRVCETGTFGVNCTSQCSCGVGALNCDNVIGCVCKSGWMGLTCDQDVNECATEVVAAECLNKSAICVNDPGSYRCSCRPGYRKDITGVCQDINECVDSPCSQICENNAGSYRCLCNAGFSLNVETNECEDTNECLLSVDNQCTQECINTYGGYRCSCYQFGYVLANDGYSCTARDVCAPNNCSVTNGGCIVVNGTDTCFCNTGYNWTGTECVLPVVDWCSRANCNQTCHNLTQSPYYKCDCNPGFQLNPDGKTCRRCAAWTYGNCSTNCACNPQHSINCSNTNGTCLCADGWTGDKCDLDIDECSLTGTYNCPANSRCVNTLGSYICVCATGYIQTASGNCSACSHYTYGDSCAFKCSCSVVNTASCDNVNGTCYCKTGWTGKNCTEDINECTENSYNCSGQNINCSNTDGGYECVCNKGYAFNDSRICVDIDECIMGTHSCLGSNEKCWNKNGSYDCVCQQGFSYNVSRVCVACRNYTYGDNCTRTCNCSSVNTDSCDNVDGTCYCRPGWTRTSCDLDIDECATNTHNCTGDFENCNNTDGGFECLCQPGYHYNDSQLCVGTTSPTTSFTTTHLTSSSYSTVSSTNTEPTDSIRSISLSLTISGVEFNETVFNKSYNEIKLGIEKELFQILKKNVTSLIAVIVHSMRRGSVIVDNATALLNSSTQISYLGVALANIPKANVTILNQTGSVSSVYNKTDPCDIFTEVVNCEHGCHTSNGTPSCKILSPEENDNELVIGLAVGIPLFFIFVGVIAFVIYIRQKKSSERPDFGNDDEHYYSSLTYARNAPTRKAVSTNKENYNEHQNLSEFDQSSWGTAAVEYSKGVYEAIDYNITLPVPSVPGQSAKRLADRKDVGNRNKFEFRGQ